MRRQALVLALLAFAATAHGTSVVLSMQQQNTLTPIDSVPTTSELDALFPDAGSALDGLALIAQDSTTDVGIRIRALHALTQYCAAPCADGDPAHQALVQFIVNNQTDATGTTSVMLRSAIEALGPQRVATDLTLLEGLLDHPSRDIRAATAHALRDLCNTNAILDLRIRESIETTDQVRLAISEALRVLGQPSPCP